jgi:hypothetical protein
MIVDDIERMKKVGFKVEEVPTGYIFSMNNEAEKDIVLHKEPCEILQKIGKIEKIEVISGKHLRVVVLTPVIGSG